MVSGVFMGAFLLSWFGGARVGSGGEVYIGAEGRGKRGEGRGERCKYEETGAMPVVVVEEEKEKMHKTWYITLYEKLFRRYQK